MQNNRSRSFTLIELLIGTVLLTIIVLGIVTVELYSHHQLLSSDRRARLQNEVALVLEHMTKNIGTGTSTAGGAIGDVAGTGLPVDTAAITGCVGCTTVRAFIDYNRNGKRDTSPTDRWIGYAYTGSAGPAASRYQIRYYPNPASSTAYEVLATHIVNGPNVLTQPAFQITYPAGVNLQNIVHVTINACWDPSGATFGACGTEANPDVTMSADIKMPSVSTH